jgi:hypothetical protein
VCVTDATEFVTGAAALAKETGVRRQKGAGVCGFGALLAWCLSPLQNRKGRLGGDLFLFLSYKFSISD